MNERDKEREENITRLDDDQIFGDNDQIAPINIEERNKNLENEDTAQRTRDIMKQAEDTRERLNRKKNEVRDYGADARETTL